MKQLACPHPACPLDDVRKERDTLARRVDSLWRQRKMLVGLLAKIEKNGGVGPTEWGKIDRVLLAAGIKLISQDRRIEVRQEGLK